MIGSIAGYHDSSGAFKITNRYSCRYLAMDRSSKTNARAGRKSRG